MSVEKREHIMKTAISLFATKGFEGTSVRDLASAADVNIAMINYYFGSKEKLFESIVQYKISYTRSLLDEFLNDASLSSIQKIDKVIDLYVQRLFSNREFHKVLHHELMLNQRSELATAILTVLSHNLNSVKQIVETGIQKGEFRQVDVTLTVASLTGTLNSILLSKKMCCHFYTENGQAGYEPYEDEAFRKRVTNHLKQLMRSHLLLPQAITA